MTVHIHIKGKPATGKTTVAEAMMHQLEAKGHAVLLSDASNVHAKPMALGLMNRYDFIIWDDFIQNDVQPTYVIKCKKVKHG